MTIPVIESKQMAILRFIWQNTKINKFPPTVREICDGVNLSSTSTVYGHLTRLAKKGYIIKNPSKQRALEITKTGLKKLGINNNHNMMPIIGDVAAGSPILALQNPTDFFPIPEKYLHIDVPLFMLTIRGNSMINMGILDGDKVIVKKQSTANNGEVVIAMNSDNEATCKRFFKEDHYYRLQPENDNLDPIILKQVSILGIVIGLYRDHIK